MLDAVADVIRMDKQLSGRYSRSQATLTTSRSQAAASVTTGPQRDARAAGAHLSDRAQGREDPRGGLDPLRCMRQATDKPIRS